MPQWIAIGDIHEHTAYCQELPTENSGILVSGDLTNFGHAAGAQRVLTALQAVSSHIYAVTGNLDYPDVDALLASQDRDLHVKRRNLAPDVCAIGLKGSVPTPFHTPGEFTEAQYTQWLGECRTLTAGCRHVILISHNPPFQTACDRISSGLHVGSHAVRAFIEEVQPDVCICGHIHEARACDRIGRTQIINPGEFGNGWWVRIGTDTDGLRAELVSPRQGSAQKEC